MSEVAAGGRTVFPRLGASVEPTAGSAVFWFNLLANGHPDTDTLHGACPVVYGTKWGTFFSFRLMISVVGCTSATLDRIPVP